MIGQIVLLVGRPGDDVSSCPFCGEPIAYNKGVQRISHQLPMCDAFRAQVRAQSSFAAAAAILKSRTVQA